MEKLGRLSAEDRDDLIAYLDGELDEKSSRHIEQILAKSSVARGDVELLARSYELLDLLPQTKASTDFAEKTLATARLEDFRKPLQQQPWFRASQRGAILAGWTLAMVLSAACGYALTNRWVPEETDPLVDDLAVVRDFDVYAEVGSIEFLHALASERQLLEDIKTGVQP